MASRGELDDLAPIDPTDHVARAERLLEWARLKGFRVGPVLEIGDIKMQISDIRQIKHEGLARPAPEETGPYKELGFADEDPAPGTG